MEQAMHFPDFRLWQAAVVLAEELNFSRAADRLHIVQPTLSKQILELEQQLGFRLFLRNIQSVRMTDAGEQFVREAREVIFHAERAMNLARSAALGAQSVIHIGKSPYVDPYLISTLSAVTLPLYPGIHIQFSSLLAPELEQRLLEGKLDMAIITSPSDTPKLTRTELAKTGLYVAMCTSNSLARKHEIAIRDLHLKDWIMFERHGHPFTIVGVAAPTFFGAKLDSGGNMLDFWLPLTTEPMIASTASRLKNPRLAWLSLIGRVRPKTKPQNLETELNVELHQWLESHASDMNSQERKLLQKQTLRLTPGGAGISPMREEYKDGLLLLLLAAACVLLAACANVANLMLARGLKDRWQTGIRLTLGAPRSRLVRKALVDSLGLALIGGIAAIPVAYVGARLILRLAFAGPDTLDTGKFSLGIRSSASQRKSVAMADRSRTISAAVVSPIAADCLCCWFSGAHLTIDLGSCAR